MNQEWKNGDVLYYPDGFEVTFIGMDGEYPVIKYWNELTQKNEFIVEFEFDLSKTKPETREQRKERERDDLGKAMWTDFGYSNPKTPTWESLKPEYAECWRVFAEKTGYRKDREE